MDFLGVPWERLTLDDVRVFLANQDDEGVTWEAKGPDPKRLDARFEARLVYRSACGLANTLGGFVIGGASRGDADGPWSLPGVAIPHSEPETWLADAVGSLRPRPRFETHAWPLDDGRTAFVVRVEPIAVPPCMTAGGEIYERVSSKTVRVTDPLVLTRLLERGEAARSSAEVGAKTAVRAAIAEEPLRRNELLRLVVALRATGYEPDISSRLFRRSTADKVGEIVRARLTKDRYTAVEAVNEFIRQDRFGVRTVPSTALSPGYVAPDHAWSVVLSWDGAVSVRCAAGYQNLGMELLFEDVLVPAWSTAADLVDSIGGFGDAYVVVELAGSVVIHAGFELGEIGVALGGSREIARDTEVAAPPGDLVESVKRELLRSLTLPVWEPEESDEA